MTNLFVLGVAQIYRIDKELLQGTIEGKRRRRSIRTVWLDNIKELTQLPVGNLLDATQGRAHWIKVVPEAFVCAHRLSRSRD